MKIALVANTSWNIYNFRLNLVHFFLAHKYEILCIAPIDVYTEELKKLPVTFIPIKIDSKGNNPFKDAYLVAEFFSIYNKHKPDVILQYTIKPNIYGTIAARMCKIPVMNTVTGLGTVFLHNNIVTKLAQVLYRFSFTFAHTVVFQNEDDRNVFLEKKIVTKEQTTIIQGSGVNTGYFKPALKKEENGGFIFLMVARLLYDKGIREYAKASTLLYDTYGTAVTCILIGAIDSDKKLGIDKQDVEQWAREHKIIYKPFDRAIVKAYQQATVVVLPSYREGLSKSLLEAAACGKPLLASNVSGCKETIIDSWNGYLCNAKDAADLYHKMNLMVQLPAKRLVEMGNNSRSHAEQNFSDKTISNDYFCLIKQIEEKNDYTHK